MQTRTQTHTRQRAAAHIALAPFFANDDLLSLVILECLPAATLPAVCKQWRRLADSERIWKRKCVESFPATAHLVGVTNVKHLFARLSGYSIPAPTKPKPALPPGLSEYQFLVKLTAGDEVLLDTCLSGHDGASAATWTSLEHQRVVWPVTLPHTAVRGLADAVRTDSVGVDAVEDCFTTKLGEVLDAVAGRESAPWHVSVTTFRAADQRCELLMTGGCREDSQPSDRSFLELGSPVLELGSPYSSEMNAGHSLDAFNLRQRGFKIVAPYGFAWFVPGDGGEDDDDYLCYSPYLWFQVTLVPCLRASGAVEWDLELALECDGPKADDGELWEWDGSYLEGCVQHSIFLRGLNEQAITQGIRLLSG